MKKLSRLKTLPLAGLLAMGLGLGSVLPPAVSMADDHRGRGHDRVYKKHDGGKSHQREYRQTHRGGKGHRAYDHRPYSGHHKGHKHGHGHKHYGHQHRGHKHVDHVIVHNHYDDWNDYDRFRLLLGLHFNNVDLIYRDY
ncbi:MAG: hypothetical protein WBO73_14925 [Gammaproteobacteria bacterium]